MSGDPRLSFFSDADSVRKKLTEGGLSATAAADKASLFGKSAEALRQVGVAEDKKVGAYFVPGRIEVLGKHTDYAGGRSVVATAEKGFCLIAAPRADRRVNIYVAATGEKSEFFIAPDLTPTMGHWSNYPMTVVRRVARNFPGELKGMDLAFESDLPPAAGMSSSSAMMVSVFLVWAKINNLYQRREYTSNIDGMEALAGYLGTVENGQSFGTLTGDKGVGTFGGSEDHTAILCARPKRLSQYCYCPVRFERFIDVPEGYIFAIAGSGVVAEKTGAARAKYNRASLLATAVKNLWNQQTGRNDLHLAAALASSDQAVRRMRDILKKGSCDGFTGKELSDRFEQFYAESEEIIPAAGDAMNNGDMESFGRQVDRSQKLTTTQLVNQVPETVFLAKTARELGAAAASAFGAGFGGSVWSLAAADKAEELLQNWARRYHTAYPKSAANARYFLTYPGPSAFALV